MIQTPLAQWHREHQGRLVDFAGWEMPIQYGSIVDEHQAVRNGCGLFDIGHMGRIAVSGRASLDFLNSVASIEVSRLEVSRVRYALATNEQGGVRDDILIYRLPDSWLVVVNASNREKLWAEWSKKAAAFADLELVDRTLSTGMIAIQGPAAASQLERYCPGASQLKYYRCASLAFNGIDVLVSRTGYTGEDGFELITPLEQTLPIWEQLLAGGAGEPCVPCGLGCRDTLRLEAGMPLYGHELEEQIDPLSAGLEFAVALEKPTFPGREALLKLRASGLQHVRVGLILEGRRIAREHCAIENTAGKPVGYVTSGTFSPTLQKTIAMAYVSPEFASLSTPLVVDIRGTKFPAYVTELPFYRRKKA